VGHKHSKAEILDGAMVAASDDGLSQLTFGRLARRLGISDRVVVYYFPTKHDLIGEVLAGVGSRLQATLAEAVTRRAADHLEMVRMLWPVLATPEADPVLALFFEANGLAASGREPYRSLVPELVRHWIAWAVELIDAPPERRLIEAEAAIALADGLLLLRQLAGPEAAERAANGIGVTGPPR
jgi:AcrR family transcriptional regulator